MKCQSLEERVLGRHLRERTFGAVRVRSIKGNNGKYTPQSEGRSSNTPGSPARGPGTQPPAELETGMTPV